MRITVFILCLFLTGYSAEAQILRGTVIDGAAGKPLFSVSIFNLNNEQSCTTNEQGYYALPAKKGDELSFSFIGYHTVERLATPGSELDVEMLPLSVQMQEYILHPDYTPYQKDSAQLASLYSKELNTKPIKPGFSTDNGGGFTGLIGGPVQRISKSYKRNKKFKKNFKKDEEQKFIDTRYTPELTGAITGFAGDSLAIFMNTYPMEYPFARSATDLELKMWIRSNYKNYIKPQPLQSLSTDAKK